MRHACTCIFHSSNDGVMALGNGSVYAVWFIRATFGGGGAMFDIKIEKRTMPLSRCLFALIKNTVYTINNFSQLFTYLFESPAWISKKKDSLIVRLLSSTSFSPSLIIFSRSLAADGSPFECTEILTMRPFSSSLIILGIEANTCRDEGDCRA